MQIIIVKTLGSLQPYIMVISVAYLLCMAQLSRDNSNLKQGLKIAILLPFSCNQGSSSMLYGSKKHQTSPEMLIYKSSARQF